MSSRKFNWGLRWQFIIIFLLIIAVSVFSIGYTAFFAQKSDQAVIEDQRKRVSEIGTELANLLGKSFSSGSQDEKVVAEFVNAAEKVTKSNPRVKASLYLPEKGIISSQGPLVKMNLANPHASDSVLDIDNLTKIKEIGNIAITSKKPFVNIEESRLSVMISYGIPIDATKNGKAAIIVRESMPVDFFPFRAVRSIIFLLIFGGSTFGMIAMLYITRKLVKGTNQIKKGLALLEEDINYRLPNQKGELGEIVSAINKMGDSLVVKEQLEQHVQRSERLASLGRLVAGVAHEIRNPLGIIKTSVQVMSKQYNDHEIKEFLDVINEQVERQNKIIHELLSYAKPVKPLFQPIAVNSLINSVLTLSNKYIQEHQVEIVIKLDEQNPEIIGDGEKLKQVFINLIFNAVQAMPAGGKLQIATGAEEGKVFISFTDNGEGINPLHLDKLFDPFFTTRDKGTGLGLAIVHQIIELHGGNVEVVSEPGEGSVFKVILPKNKTGEV